MKRWKLYLAAGVLLLAQFPDIFRSSAQSTPAPSIAQQMEDFWQGKAHFQEIRNIDWAKPPYNAPRQGEGWFGNPMPFPGNAWYLFNRRWLTQNEKPSYCQVPGWQVYVRESTDAGRSWSNPAVLVAAPGPETAPDACGTADGSSYYDHDTDTWQMLTQCLAAHNAAAQDTSAWMVCHYVRHGPSPMGRFSADATPALRSGQLWAKICGHPGAICNARSIPHGTPDIIYKKSGYFYVTFNGFDHQAGRAFRIVARTADFHHWITSGPGLPNAPIFSSSECQAWNPGCVGGGEASTLIAGNYQYMMIETPTISLGCVPGQNWPIALLRGPWDSFRAWSSPLWEQFHANPLLTTARSDPHSKCSLQYPRWAVTANHIYILYEDYGPNLNGHLIARPLLKLVPGAGPPVALRIP